MKKESDELFSSLMSVCEEHKITPNQAYILYIISTRNKDAFRTFKVSCHSDYYMKEEMYWLIIGGFLSTTDGSQYSVTWDNINVVKNIFEGSKIIEEKENKVESNFDSFFNEWYSMWPIGVKSGSYRVRSGKSGCVNKMLKFIKKNPEISQDIILEATSAYIKSSKLNGYMYMKLAGYFIDKDGESTLLSECEHYEDKQKDSIIDDEISSGANDLELL